jgi:predicted nucleic acid-binding protein
VTDAYLVALAASKGGRVATFDAGMKATWGQHVELIPS